MTDLTPVKFTREQLRALQCKELETLLYFKDFCEKNGLLFYFCGGCCIGTIRNNGFIPWDDDIDIFMPREDYEKMHKLWEEQCKNPRFLCLRTDDHIFTGNIFTTIVDTSATCVKKNQAHLDIPHGLAMDVFPLDGCPKGFKRKMQKMWAMVYSLFLAQVVPEKHGSVIALGSRVLLSVFRGDKIRQKIWRMAQCKMTKYKIQDCEFITELCTGPKYMQYEYPKEAFASAVYKDFEGYQMPIPVGYEQYLKIAFGAYETLPPKQARVPHHEVVYLDLTRSCYDFDRKKLFSEKSE
ncbi:MAG TPA: LicD family protein [Candidatus Scatavimonas merdigallinarum]|uniref:LicD family protein n=1 Tax=Candidatus Scatavimonas merdigallinarum TaxID=2840914 RepID=A0A9D0ZHW1_9FIRM|nr:LicD family protein [Candidatus Scatavimonas merdigallinarum]